MTMAGSIGQPRCLRAVLSLLSIAPNTACLLLRGPPWLPRSPNRRWILVVFPRGRDFVFEAPFIFWWKITIEKRAFYCFLNIILRGGGPALRFCLFVGNFDPHTFLGSPVLVTFLIEGEHCLCVFLIYTSRTQSHSVSVLYWRYCRVWLIQ